MTDRVRFAAALADRYRVEREIGAGGMARVYLAHDLVGDRKVAIKVLRPDLAAILGTERFLREIQIATQLDHPRVVGLLDSGTVPPAPGEAQGSLYYVMPYIDGESLRGRMVREPQLPLDTTVNIASQVAEALDYANGKGLVHRDIKPENILLSGDQVFVTDFGIARAIGNAGGSRLTELAILQSDSAALATQRKVLRATQDDNGGAVGADRTLAAFQLLLRNKKAAAADSLAAIDLGATEPELMQREPFARSVDHLAGAQLLLELGDTVRALQLLPWTEADVGDLTQVWFAPIADLWLARIADAQHRKADAIYYYRQFLQRYDFPTPATRPLIDEARRALARLYGLAEPARAP